MHLMYFTEQPMSAYPVEEGKRLGYTATMFPNKYFDPVEATRLYHERLEEYLYAEEMGVDGIMLNEHHNAPFTMQSKINIFASLLAGMTKRVKIVLLGNPLPVCDNPVRLAEEIAMIDLISKGRLVSGIVRGAGQEQIATNANPAYNRERFEEAHDLLIKTWSVPGPFRWEGNHYQFRVVNPWVLPLQKPHPRIWVPGVVSRETVVWAAEQRYPYIALNTTIEATKAIWKIYDEAAKRVGYKSGPENRGYLIRCHVAETEEKAIENAREFLWMQGEFLGLAHPVWANPSGYGSPATRRQRLEARKRVIPSFEQQLEMMQIIAGTPEQVVKKLRILLEGTRPSILALWGNDGMVNHEDSMTCIRLLGQEVMPALREIGKELELFSPIELDTPVSLAATPQHELTPSSA
ncbi:MAG: LLM class flavin-dependent oxidoreductase [Chloroflexi bacterium]|nr:LLM class flavin-dependent oxidoreductase [Chloroflexota bacterium]